MEDSGVLNSFLYIAQNIVLAIYRAV